jgi:hypothetical protein
MILLSGLLLLGCPQPPRPDLEFFERPSTTTELEVHLLEGQLKLSISGRGSNPYRNRYEVGLSLKAEFADTLGTGLEFDTKAVQVLIDGVLMRRKIVAGGGPSFLRSDDDSFEDGLLLWADLPDSIGAQLDPITSRMTINLDGFVLLDGTPLAIDPVNAIDPGIRARLADPVDGD